ncbi:MAG: hypothetical protein ACOC9T_00205 [Myxococcota bacterium]
MTDSETRALDGAPVRYEWRWTQTRYGPLAAWLPERKGEACDVVARGRNGSVLVEFADGRRVVAPRYAVRVSHG